VILNVKQKFNAYWMNWVKKRNRPGNPQILTSHNVYILPSRFGSAYGFVVITLFSAAINYEISTIYLMTFLLFVIGMASAVEAHANLKDLSFTVISIDDAQQGTPAKITLFIQPNHKIRFGIELKIASHTKLISRIEKIPTEGLQIIIALETTSRGCFTLPPIIVSSLFPFGIFKVWSYLYFNEHYYVIPQPENPGFWPPICLDENVMNVLASGDEELYELKQVENPWMAPNLIAWKISAKNQSWYQKVMQNNEVGCWLFKLSDLSANDLELKLQQLSYWLQTAELNGQIYGLQLTTSRISFSRGKEHLKRCLRQLAVYQ